MLREKRTRTGIIYFLHCRTKLHKNNFENEFKRAKISPSNKTSGKDGLNIKRPNSTEPRGNLPQKKVRPEEKIVNASHYFSSSHISESDPAVSSKKNFNKESHQPVRTVNKSFFHHISNSSSNVIASKLNQSPANINSLAARTKQLNNIDPNGSKNSTNLESAPKPRKKKKSSWIAGIGGYEKVNESSIQNNEPPSSIDQIEMTDDPANSNATLKVAPKLERSTDVAKIPPSLVAEFLPGVSEEILLSYCLPIFSYSFHNASPKIRYVIDLQVALFLGFKNSRLFLDQFPSLKLRVITQNEKEILEQTPLSSSIFHAMIKNGNNAKWLKTITLPSGTGLSLHQYDLQFLELSELENLGSILKRLNNIGGRNIKSLESLLYQCVLTDNGVIKDSGVGEASKEDYVHKLKRK